MLQGCGSMLLLLTHCLHVALAAKIKKIQKYLTVPRPLVLFARTFILSLYLGFQDFSSYLLAVRQHVSPNPSVSCENVI